MKLKNRLAQCIPTNFHGEVRPEGLEHEAERALLAALDRVEPLGPAGSRGGAARSSTDRGPGDAAGRYEQALQRLTALADPVDRFFADVMVMAEDETVRTNRLALLSRVVRLMRPFADLTRVVAGEGKASPAS